MEPKQKEEMIGGAQQFLDSEKVRVGSKLRYRVIALDCPCNYIVDVSDGRVSIRIPLPYEIIEDMDSGKLRAWFRRAEMEIRKTRVAGKEI